MKSLTLFCLPMSETETVQHYHSSIPGMHAHMHTHIHTYTYHICTGTRTIERGAPFSLTMYTLKIFAIFTYIT